jgi:hypothetical protein
MTIAQQLNITEFPFDIKNEEGRLIYTELSNGYWCKWEFDQDGNVIYTEDSDGYILYKRPKPEPEPEKNMTAVEWLEKQLDSTQLYWLKDWIEQAKAMEKEQIEEAYENGVGDENERNLSGQFTKAKQYYAKTYGGDK